MEEKSLISIIVPVYKVEQYLPRCVDSLLAQTYPHLEIILVDDGSPDGSGEICDGYAKKDPRIRVIHKENGGLSSARNAGIEVAKGEYLGFVDSDDWVEPETYETLLTMARQENVKLVCCGRFDFSSKTGQKKVGLCPQKREVISGEELVHRMFLWENVDSAAWDKLYHHSLFRQIRYPLGKIVEDVPTTYRIALEAGRAGMIPMPLYNYFHRPGSITTAAISEKSFHFMGHTAQIEAHIREAYPRLLPEATYLRVSSLAYTVNMVEQSRRADQRLYRDEYLQAKRELRGYLPFILTSPLLKKKDRRLWLLLALGLYAPLRKLRDHLRK